jgi:hypothetical protein
MTSIATTQTQLLDHAAQAIGAHSYAEADSFTRAIAQILAGVEAAEAAA